ncbi:uncharacterized protein LOC128264289 isoform X2 [Drosophila gunungcola]|uniref:Hydra n=1 Tax=Drosophila gunungcola TaxID=103775 RepID=A0A9P9YCT4_9MUSC|nr:uncharacterized protein LOC128264289 isoform X2 [Drosophila gunungcola]KAI8034629.1 hypothetical protein M5D96_012591 [Drosophila gunungcola]
MFSRGLNIKNQPCALVCGLLLRNFSKNFRRMPMAFKSNNFNWPTLQRIRNIKDVDVKDEKPYSTYKVDNNRAHEMWQKARIGAREQNSLRGHQPANSDVNSDSEEIFSALDKVRQIEERRKIHNKMQILMQEQQALDEQMQDEKDRVAPIREALVEREPVQPTKPDPPREYAPIRSDLDSCRSGPWISATVLAATGNYQQLRNTPKPYRTNGKSGQAVSQPEKPSLPGNSACSVPKPITKLAQVQAQGNTNLDQTNIEERMDKWRSENEYSKESACLKLCHHSVVAKRGYR